MITPNTDSAFIQIKSIHLQDFAWLNGAAAEVVEMTMQLRKELVGWDDSLLSAVDETLKQIFKEEGVAVIYTFFENKYHLKPDEIAWRPKDFSAGLKMLLGSAAPAIEKAILQNLNSKLGLEFVEKEDFEFSDYVTELRERSSGAIV
jgi:predicted translin family RNA/ssDNA-binding protein